MTEPKRQFRQLDWLNFWMADVQSGIGPFLAAALTSRGWNPSRVGTVLTMGGLTGLVLQTPAGALVDATRHKRALLAAGVLGIAAASLPLAFSTRFAAVLGAQILLGSIGPFVAPCIVAVTLGLVGRSLFNARLGRNQSFNAAGNVFAALTMGLVGWRWGAQASFLAVPIFAIPALLSIAAIPARQIDHQQARGADSAPAGNIEGLSVLLRDRVLLAFAIAGFLFHLANAAMLPQLAELLTRGNPSAAAPFMSASITVTQLVITVSSIEIGTLSSSWGAKRLLLIGFAVLPVRAVLYTLTTSIPLLLSIQALDGVANAIFGISSAVYLANRTKGTGRFNLSMGAFGTVTGVGAALSTVLAGSIAQSAGFSTSFLVLAGIALLALLCLLLFVPDTAETPHPNTLQMEEVH